MSDYFNIQLQVSELNNTGDYTLTVTSIFPNKSFSSGKIELATEGHRLLSNQDDIELFCHVASRKPTGREDMHDYHLVWNNPRINLGQKWKRLFCHLILDERCLLASLVYDSANESLDQSFVEGKKQKLSEIATIVNQLRKQGLSASVMVHKEKGNGC